MKAISLWEPWATAIAIGAKGYETRSWATSYRGPIAIHAAKTRQYAGLILHPDVREVFAAAGITDPDKLPFGCVVAVANLADCQRTEDLIGKISGTERALGDYTPGRFAWKLTGVSRFETPIPARGAQGFWRWER